MEEDSCVQDGLVKADRMTRQRELRRVAELLADLVVREHRRRVAARNVKE